jgi:hypothetical protein
MGSVVTVGQELEIIAISEHARTMQPMFGMAAMRHERSITNARSNAVRR